VTAGGPSFVAWLAVQCSDLSHEGRTVKVITYRRLGSDGRWSRGGTGTRVKDPFKGPFKPMKPSKRPWPKPYADTLVEETLIETTEQHRSLDPDNSRARRRHTLECPLCGLKVDMLNETLYPILDKLADHDIPVIELGDLAAIISKASRSA